MGLKNYEEIDANIVDGFRHSLTQQLPYGTSFVLLMWPDNGVGSYHHLINADRRQTIQRMREVIDILEGRRGQSQSEYR